MLGSREFRFLCCKINNLKELISDNHFYITIWAEQNGSLVTNRWNFSFGNGNEANGIGATGQPGDWGYVTHYDWELISMSLGSRLTNSADTEVEVTVNGVSIGQSTIIPAPNTKAINNTVTYSGSAGDVINFRTLQVGGGNDVVPSIILRYKP